MASDDNVKYLAWMDFETTGLDFNNDFILEAACAITDLEYNHIGPAVSYVIQPSNHVERELRQTRLSHNQFVFDMHSQNRLIDDLADGSGTTISVFFAKVAKRFREVGEPGEFRLAGSGVERFDRHFIAKLWPAGFDEWMHYRCHDVSNVRSFITDIGLGWTLPATAATEHRALPDVVRSIGEGRRLAEWMTSLVSQKPIRT